MDRPTDVHEITLTFEFPPFGLARARGEGSEDLVGLLVLRGSDSDEGGRGMWLCLALG